MRPTSPRLRLPLEFRRLKDDFGRIIRERRKEGYGTQAAVAEEAGIARETLSRIERGNRPAYASTFDRLFAVLDMDWGAIAEKGPTRRVSRIFHGSFRDDTIHAMGQALRAGRRAQGISLREASARSGISVAQLSRIERGEARRSRTFADHPEDENLDPEDRQIVFVNPYLASLCPVKP